MSAGRDLFSLAYEISPIILTGGIAQYIPGGALPIVSLTQALDFAGGILAGAGPASLSDFFANFVVLTGGTMIKQEIGEYTFANATTAANAVIGQPLNVSFKMICPARGDGAMLTRLPIMMALQATLQKHNNLGGTYTCVTPALFYPNCVMIDVPDVSSNGSKQAQTEWQMNFRKPLLTLEDAFNIAQSQNNLMSSITNGTQINGQPAWSGQAAAVGNPMSLQAPSVIPAAQNTAGSGVAAPFFGAPT